MTIIDKVKKSVEEATGLPFYYDDKDTLNELMDGAQFPCAVSGLVDQSAMADTLGVYHERLTLSVIFANLSDYDFDGLKNEEIIDGCKRHALRWLSSLRNCADFRVVSVGSVSRVYLEYDALSTGYGVTITIEETEGFGACNE